MTRFQTVTYLATATATTTEVQRVKGTGLSECFGRCKSQWWMMPENSGSVSSSRSSASEATATAYAPSSGSYGSSSGSGYDTGDSSGYGY